MSGDLEIGDRITPNACIVDPVGEFIRILDGKIMFDPLAGEVAPDAFPAIAVELAYLRAINHRLQQNRQWFCGFE